MHTLKNSRKDFEDKKFAGESFNESKEIALTIVEDMPLFDFPGGKFYILATSEGSFYNESKQGGELDIKRNKMYGYEDMNVLGFVDGKLMSTRDFGNQTWGQAATKKNIPGAIQKLGAGFNNLYKTHQTTVGPKLGALTAGFLSLILPYHGEDAKSASMSHRGYRMGGK